MSRGDGPLVIITNLSKSLPSEWGSTARIAIARHKVECLRHIN